ncbi:MAG: FtsX-like permease family protein, partial [Candidatus Pararuminococcus gallinarum]
LTNININERIRELATIKVLGFYDREVSAYIYRENTISALIGMAVGLVVGIFFERFVILTAEVDMVMFVPDIAPYCFILAAVLTILFTVIVNIVVHFKLKKIDMVESLKSVE